MIFLTGFCLAHDMLDAANECPHKNDHQTDRYEIDRVEPDDGAIVQTTPPPCLGQTFEVPIVPPNPARVKVSFYDRRL